MSVPATSPPKRHALGLPEGSVRSILALLVVGLVCSVLLIPQEPLPPYLLYLLFLILGHYFAAVGNTARDQPGPLHLPGGLVRLVIILALAGSIGWVAYSDPEGLAARWNTSIDLIRAQWFMPVVLLAGFFVGVLLRMIVGRDSPSYFVQDFEAWIALVGVVGLCIAALIHLVITPSTGRAMSMPTWESFLAAVVAFYFGARS